MSGPAWSTQLAHDRVLVVGAGSGIGRALAIELSAAGATVYAAGRRIHRLEETAELAAASPAAGRVVPVGCDLTSPEQVASMFGQIEADGGPVPAVVNSAAAAHYKPAALMSPDEFDEAIDWSIRGGFKLLHRWGTTLMAAGLPGVAVTLTSGLATRGTPGVAGSSAGKAGLEALTKTLGREWGPAGLRLNAVGVGLFPVEKSREMWADPDLHARLTDQIALGRYGELPEIVGPIMFLLSSAASYITGHVLFVEGGTRLSPWPIPPEKIAAGRDNVYENESTP